MASSSSSSLDPNFPSSGTWLTYDTHPGTFVVEQNTDLKNTFLACDCVAISPKATLKTEDCYITGVVAMLGKFNPMQTRTQGAMAYLVCSQMPLSDNQYRYFHKYDSEKIILSLFQRLNHSSFKGDLAIGQKFVFEFIQGQTLMVQDELTIKNTMLVGGKIFLLPGSRLKLEGSYIATEIIQCEGSSIESNTSFYDWKTRFKAEKHSFPTANILHDLPQRTDELAKKIYYKNLQNNCLVVEKELSIQNTTVVSDKIIQLPHSVLKLTGSKILCEIVQCEGCSIESDDSSTTSSIRAFTRDDGDDLNPIHTELLKKLAKRV